MKIVFFKFFFVVFLSNNILSCSTYQHQVDESRVSLELGKTATALSHLKSLADKKGKDQLVHLLDYALALQISGQFRDSVKYFLLADKIASENDYYSISKITSSVLLSEEMLQYKGDDYEKLLINAMLMINFSVLGEKDAALVETKKSLQKIDNLKISKVIKNSFTPFLYYLNAIIWEINKEWDDAYIDYLNAYKANSGLEQVIEGLYRTAVITGREQMAQKWYQMLSLKSHQKKQLNSSEVIVIFQQGWGPRKVSSYSNRIIPELRPVPSQYYRGYISIDGYEKKVAEEIMNVERASMEALRVQLAPLIAKRTSAIVGKTVLAREVYKKDQGLGLLTDLLLSVSERADLRQWSILPKTIQIARMPVASGQYDVEFIGDGGTRSSKVLCQFPKVLIRKNEKKILSCRGF